jgi:hypothetical protein
MPRRCRGATEATILMSEVERKPRQSWRRMHYGPSKRLKLKLTRNLPPNATPVILIGPAQGDFHQMPAGPS